MATYQPNRPIPLATTQITEIDGQPANVPVEVVLRLLPFPSVYITYENIPETMLRKSPFGIVLEGDMRLDAMRASFDFGSSAGSLVPARQPVDVLDKSRLLDKVTFGVLNFPPMPGSQNVIDNTGTLLPHVTMEAGVWRVELAAVPDVWNVVEKLKHDSGYSIIYSGTLSRVDGASFQSNDAAHILTALRAFLSFARGAACGITLINGEDKGGQTSWIRWGTYHTEPWKRRSSWFRELNGADVLSTLFSSFVRRLEKDAVQKRSLLQAIDWYTQSNITAPYIGIILTLASLERLAGLVRGGDKREKELTGNFIKESLVQSGIPVEVPEACTALAETQEAWEHGPHAVTSVRNNLVHPKSKLAGVSDYAIHDAWKLGQWYFEMMLLNVLGYQGDYVNRLASWYDHDQYVLPVPWAVGQQAT